MTPKELQEHKLAPKSLGAIPKFKELNKKNNSYPKPLDMLGRRKNAFASGLIALSDTHEAFFLYRGGDILTDTSFYGYVFCRLANGSLYPLYEFHWHPSHKGLHCKLPCNTTLDYNGRLLKAAPELSLNSDPTLDPRKEKDREELISLFCESCGIQQGWKSANPAPVDPQFELGLEDDDNNQPEA